MFCLILQHNNKQETWGYRAYHTLGSSFSQPAVTAIPGTQFLLLASISIVHTCYAYKEASTHIYT